MSNIVSSMGTAQTDAGSAAKGGNPTNTGGNLGGASGAAVSATGSAAKHYIPGANAGVEQVGNTLQQSLPMVFIESGLGAAVIGRIYDDILEVSQDYLDEFREDFFHWQGFYKPFLRNSFVPGATTQNPLYYGDGRGVQNPYLNPDRDLFRRAQVAASNLKDLDIAWRTKRRIVSRYAHGEMRMDDVDAALRRLHIHVDNRIIAERIEDIREDEFNNRRWNRLLQAANIGITASNIAASGYTSAIGAYTGAMQGMANYKTALGNQISAAAGNYMQGRTDGANGE